MRFQTFLITVVLVLLFPSRTSSQEATGPVKGALALLQSAGYCDLPPVRLVDEKDFPQFSEKLLREMRGATAFRVVIHDPKDYLDPTVYLYRESQIYRLAEEGSEAGVALLASAIAHEVAHNFTGDSGAYALEADLLEKWVLSPRFSFEDKKFLAKTAVVRRLQSKKAQTR